MLVRTQYPKSCYIPLQYDRYMTNLKVNNSFTSLLPADPTAKNEPRQVEHACFSYVMPKGMVQPQLIIYSKEVADDLLLSPAFCESQAFADVMTGNELAEGSRPYAMCYGGHQFGHWAGQLGDGRAINLGEIKTDNGLCHLQLKGAGPTPYSRSADGLAVLRSSVREFLCSEAMYHLGVPTTRALSLTLTGEKVLRDVMYDGNAAYEKGAVVCRVAPSFIRFGNFEIFASRNDTLTLKKLADYTISIHFSHLVDREDKYLAWFSEVSELTCDMIVHWQRVGFVHGVMNTDNMSILGITIDFGPYGWVDAYDPDWTPNTTDLPGKRYRFGNQPMIAQWNILKLANAIYPLAPEEDKLKDIVQQFKSRYTEKFHVMMMQKTGLYHKDPEDQHLFNHLEQVLRYTETDMTIFFRQLALVNHDSTDVDIIRIIHPAYYEPLSGDKSTYILSWFHKYRERLAKEKCNLNERIQKMNAVNPKYVLRNYMAQLAIDEADKGHYRLLNDLYTLLKKPYEEQPHNEKWYARRPDWAREKIGCSMLSCSS